VDPIAQIYELLRRLAPTPLPLWEEVDCHRYSMKICSPQGVEIFFEESMLVERMVWLWSSLQIKLPRQALKGVWFELHAVRVEPEPVPVSPLPVEQPASSIESGPSPPITSPEDEPTAADLVEDVDDDAVKEQIEADFQELLREYSDTDS